MALQEQLGSRHAPTMTAMVQEALDAHIQKKAKQTPHVQLMRAQASDRALCEALWPMMGPERREIGGVLRLS